MPTVTICTDTPFPAMGDMITKWPWEDFSWSEYDLVLPTPLIPLPEPVIPNLWNTTWSIVQAIGEMIRAQAMAVWNTIVGTIQSVVDVLGMIPDMVPFNISFSDLFDPDAILAIIEGFDYPTFPWDAIPNRPEWPDKFFDEAGNAISEWFRSLGAQGKEMMSGFIQACEDYLDAIWTAIKAAMQMVIDLIPDPFPKPSFPDFPTVPTMADILALLPSIPDLPKVPEIPGPPWDEYYPSVPDLCSIVGYLPSIPLVPFEIPCPLPYASSMATPDVDVWELIKGYLVQWKNAVTNMFWMWWESVADLIDKVIPIPTLPTLCFPIEINLKPPGLPVPIP